MPERDANLVDCGRSKQEWQCTKLQLGPLTTNAGELAVLHLSNDQ